MGRHSRKGSGATRPDAAAAEPGGPRAVPRSGGGGRRRRQAPLPPADGHIPFQDAPSPGTSYPDGPQVRGGHPEQREPGGGWGTGPQPRHGAPAGQQPYGGQAPGPSPYGATAAGARGSGARPYPQTSGPQMSGPQASGPSGPQAYGAAGHHAQDAAREEAVARQVSAQRAAQRAADGRVARQAAGAPGVMPGPRREFVDAFDGLDGLDTEAPGPADPSGPRTDSGAAGPPEEPDGTGPDAEPARCRAAKGGKGRTFTGIAAAAVTTVLAIVVAGQVAEDSAARSAAAARTADRGGDEGASRSEARPTPERPAKPPEVKPLSYAAKMAQPFPLAADLKASGEFEAVPGLAKAPGKGRKYRYRIDVEKGLSLDAGLFAEAVQKTLNDDRSWAHNGAMTFERISSGSPDFVITLASPGTTGEWCAKSGLDTTVQNVSCDSASTDRVMINAYRWAQGSATFGPKKLLPYRQMLINHEVGHRLGYGHVSCRTPGALAPVMQQQTKSLDINGIKCKPNPWAYPSS
ncbi:DUF3152 domain-containing protein [Streptomyces sp. NPDC057552]|uniref:DUF3152 domain-containing protein n=1 Tax=Streptomyces sp. NPDC057552 TaxID=3350537 RepID=UPI00367A60B3